MTARVSLGQDWPRIDPLFQLLLRRDVSASQSQFFNVGCVALTLRKLTGLWIKLKLLRNREVSGSATPPRGD